MIDLGVVIRLHLCHEGQIGEGLDQAIAAFSWLEFLNTKEKSRNSKYCFCFFGPSVEIRTRGLLNPIQARYQTSPHPDKCLRLTTASIYYHTLSENASTFFKIFKKIFIRLHRT